MNNNPPSFTPTTPTVPAPLPKAPSNSTLSYTLAGVFGVALITLGVFAGFTLTSSNSVDYNTFESYLSDETSSEYSFSAEDLENAPVDESADILIPYNYGVDSLATYRNYTAVVSEDSLFNNFSLASIALVRETISDYFSFAYPAFSFIKFSETYFNPDTPLILTSDSGKTFSVKLSVAEPSDYYKVDNIEILSSDGTSLFSYDGRFFDSSSYDLEEESLDGANDFEEIFNESSAEDEEDEFFSF